MSKALLIIAGALLLGATLYLATSAPTRQESTINEHVIAEWKKFKSEHNIEFSNADVEVYRMAVFASNLKKIAADLAGNLGVTQFSHLTQEEFVQTYLSLQVPAQESASEGCIANQSVSINWVSNGKVTSVKNQGGCGSCWAFTTTAAVESALIIAGKANNSLDLSEQQLVSCNTQNKACNGGVLTYAFDWIAKNGQTTQALYPYTGTKTDCKTVTQNLSHISGYKSVASQCTTDLKVALTGRPISVAVDATKWQNYKSGVFSDCGTTLNHGVTLVGYVSNNWIIKNSWGTTWGESGFIRLADGNTCGLANGASYPVV